LNITEFYDILFLIRTPVVWPSLWQSNSHSAASEWWLSIFFK